MKRACLVTGPKPTRFKFRYNETYALCKKIKKAMLGQFKRLYHEKGVRRFYVGGTIGVDMWAGEMLLQMKEQSAYSDIELIIAEPFPGHSAKWDIRSRKRLEHLRRNCTECHIIGERDCRESYIKRNCYMVEQSDFLVAVSDYDGKAESVMPQIMDYAVRKHKPIILIHPDTAAISGDVWADT